MTRRPLSTQDMLAAAWDDGYYAGHEDARAVQQAYPASTRNPYRQHDCMTCQGTGEVTEDDEYAECRDCWGEGVR